MANAFRSVLVSSGGSSDSYSISVTCDSYFAGTTITCSDGTSEYTATCPSVSPYTVVFDNLTSGIWTVYCGNQSEQVNITTQFSVEFAPSVPTGRTVTPTDSVQTWLQCAGILDKSYTTISEVLNDSTILRTLTNNNNAVDYMVRSTTWTTDICSNFIAMADIGGNDYCAETLLNDSTWKTAIVNSEYFDVVLNVKVPIMTSDTSPYGQAIGTPANHETANYIVFTGKTNASAHTGHWYTEDLIGAPCWIGYMFTGYRKVYLTKILWDDRLTKGTYVIQGSNDMVNWTNTTSVINETSFGRAFKSYECDASQSFIYYRVNITSQTSSAKYAGQMVALQFYGR